jgi:purine-binding chemotaxis protein CheW
MPQTPDYIRGMINLRGAVMPVLDLRNRLGRGRTEPSSRQVIVVVQQDSRLAGLLVDADQETFMVDAMVLQPPPDVETTSRELFVDAIIPMEGRPLSRLVVGALMPSGAALTAWMASQRRGLLRAPWRWSIGIPVDLMRLWSVVRVRGVLHAPAQPP